MNENKCPNCSAYLKKVRYDPNSMLNADQFDAVKRGDWFCEKCADSGETYRYFWESDLALAAAWALSADDARAEIERLKAIINTPHSDDFVRAVSIEAEHQRQRWGAEGDAGKTPADWFWLIGYLAGKALHAHAAGDLEKSEHHVITTAAACANWHRNMFGKTDMRPGIAANAPRDQA